MNRKETGRPVVHFEIGCRDTVRAEAFYAKLFDWNFSAFGPAAMVDTGAGRGINGHVNALGHEPFNYVTVYIEVENLETYVTLAGELGGKTVVPPTEIPGGRGSFAWIADPDGNVIGLFKPAA